MFDVGVNLVGLVGIFACDRFYFFTCLLYCDS